MILAMKISFASYRVYLQSLSMDDVEGIAENANDYDIAYNIADWGSFPHPYRRDDAAAFIDYAMKSYLNETEFHFGIRLKDSNKLIGVCGINNIDYKSKNCHIGYWLGKSHWGNGYAQESVELLLALAFDRMEMHRVFTSTFLFNQRSWKLLERVGFRREGTLKESSLHKEGYVDNVVYAMLNSEHKKIFAKFDTD